MVNPAFIFIGGTYRGYKLLESLIELNFKPEYVIILKEDEHEVSKYSTNITELVINNEIKFVVKKKLDQLDFDIINSKIWDFALVCGWRTIIPINLDKQFRYGFLAAHDSLLPKYRGFSPLNWAMINGENETGVTLFRINDGEVDSGDVLLKEVVRINDYDYINDIYDKITQKTIKICLELFTKFLNNELNFTKQIEEDATYTCKRSPLDGKIDWNKRSQDVFNLIRAITHPYPGAFCSYNGETYHIRKASLGENNLKNYAGRIAGKVISIKDDYIEVMCKEGTINIYLWENKRKSIICVPSQKIHSITAVLD